MPSAARPRRLVHATYPTGRCAGCDRRLVRSTEAVQGEFPLPTPDQLLVIRCRVCAECLADPELRNPQTLRRFALGILRRLWLWYATRLSASMGGNPAPAPAASHGRPQGVAPRPRLRAWAPVAQRQPERMVSAVR